MDKTNTGLIAWCKAMLGHPYWYGTICQPPTQDLYNKCAERNPKYYTASRKAQYMSDITKGLTVTDCVGLIKGYCWAEDESSLTYSPEMYGKTCPDLSANGMLSACTEHGEIDTMPDVPGILVHMAGHIGVYIGNGEVIEARGFAYGVVQTRLKDRPWKDWGKCPYITYEAAEVPESAPQAEPVAEPVETPVASNTMYVTDTTGLNVRSGAGTGHSVVRVLPVGECVAVLDTAGKWSKIGSGEWVYSSYLSANRPDAQTAQKATSANLNLRLSPSMGSRVLLVIPRWQEVTVNTANVARSDGFRWDLVTYNGVTGFAASEYLR